MEPRNHRDETPSLREARRLRKQVSGKIKQEKLFPKRSNWQYAKPIWYATLEYFSAIIDANEPKVQTAKLRDRRYDLQQIALAKLSILDGLLNAAKEDYELPADEFEQIAGTINECNRLLQSWISSENKRYGPPSEAYLYRG